MLSFQQQTDLRIPGNTFYNRGYVVYGMVGRALVSIYNDYALNPNQPTYTFQDETTGLALELLNPQVLAMNARTTRIEKDAGETLYRLVLANMVLQPQIANITLPEGEESMGLGALQDYMSQEDVLSTSDLINIVVASIFEVVVFTSRLIPSSNVFVPLTALPTTDPQVLGLVWNDGGTPSVSSGT